MVDSQALASFREVPNVQQAASLLAKLDLTKARSFKVSYRFRDTGEGLPFGSDSDDLVQRDGGAFVEWSQENWVDYFCETLKWFYDVGGIGIRASKFQRLRVDFSLPEHGLNFLTVEWNERNHRTITVSHYGYRHTVRVTREKWAKVKSLEDVSRIFEESVAKAK